MKSEKLNILLVFGTRPEVIKMAPVVQEFRKHSNRFNTKVCVTGQHRQMIDPLLKLFAIGVDYDLNIMQANQNLEHITKRVLEEVGTIIERDKIDWVLVQGDTTTAMAAALAAFYKKIKIGHVEAGLRTWDKDHPYPEEVNRKIIDSMADLYFAHTAEAKKNLLNEGIASSAIDVTGNTVIDALLESARKKFSFKGTALSSLETEKRKIILMTAHRRENIGEPLVNICAAVRELATRHAKEAVFVYPVHLNPNIHKPVHSLLGGLENVILTEPMEYLPLVHLIKKSYLVLTDSGGLQEEAPTFGKPVLVLRETTERPEGVKAGCVKVLGTGTKAIVKAVEDLLRNKQHYTRMARAKNPYGDGKAASRIVKRFLRNP
jgi:UDP-N-acetylglucosamine 2-epimerase (non-hydrolysing)